MRLIQKENLSRNESRKAFSTILEDRTTEMQQGAFISALTAKGETEEEVAGAWEAIYKLDTQQVSFNTRMPLFENSGTGMDSFKTFNVSTAASVIAAAGGIKMARHGDAPSLPYAAPLIWLKLWEWTLNAMLISWPEALRRWESAFSMV
ncbi:MAG: hypothetical protein P8Z73_16195 [Desulfobacteraceae bacterium]